MKEAKALQMITKIACTIGALWATTATQAFACSETTACHVESGEYYIAMPEDAEGPVPAMVYIHGFGGSGDSVFRNTSMRDAILARGYALIAPSGTKMEGRGGRNWSFHPQRQQGRDEVAFIQSVRGDVIANHNIDPERIMLAGFSIGGSMTSYLACQAPDSFPAYAPIGGSFWRPHPTGCEGDVRLFHTHGWNDGTVPLEGRVIRGRDIRDVGAFAQGDVFHAMDIWRQTNDCIHSKADRMTTNGAFWQRGWDRCLPGSALEFALFPGGHSIPQGWSDMVIDWFENL